MRYKYGFRVGYYDGDPPIFVCHFKTYTIEQANMALGFFERYPQRDRQTNELLHNPKWAIKHITRRQFKGGIWDELPF